MLHLAISNLSDGDVFSACISKDAFMKAPDESGINKDFIEKSTDWIATDGKAPMMRTFLIRKIIRLGGFCHAILQSVTTHSWFLARSNDELLMACERRVQQALFRLWSPRYHTSSCIYAGNTLFRANSSVV